MRQITFSALALSILLVLAPGELTARGFRGAGGGGGASRAGGGAPRIGGGGGGASRIGGGGGASRIGGGGGATARPATRPSAPYMNANRPAQSRPAPSRPAQSRPSPGGAAQTRPAPGGANVNRPSGNRPATLPGAANRPEVNRPSGGLKPSTRPSGPAAGNRPSTLPSNKLPGQGSNIGNKLPGSPSIPGLGGGAGNRPNVNQPGGVTRPNLPGGGTRPNLPGGETRPNVPGAGTRPNLPSAGSRPNLPGGGTRPNLPGGENRPNLPGAGTRPNLPGNGGRPTPGGVGDFLGMGNLQRPTTLPGTVRPGVDNGIGNVIGNRPGVNNGIGNRPIVGGGNNNSIGNRPAFGNGSGNNIGNRPNIGNGSGNRFGNSNVINNNKVNIGQVNIGNNTAISNRPGWANIDRGQINGINNRWQNQIGGLHNWQGANPNRAAYWAGWGAGVHSSYHWHHRNPGCFRGDWWYRHPCRWGGWNYGYGFAARPWNYWWTVPTYAACVNWFTWSAPQTVWAQPVYYDYGQGGNVVYNDNSVYINGNQVATSTEFAQSAADLATVPAPASEEESQKAEWMALGTFAVSAGEKDVDPTRIVQLAVSKEGIVSGTLYNTETDETNTVLGKVDKETQRVAVRFGEDEVTVAETGLYNLTQAEAPVLVHYGPDKTGNWLLVRLDDPAPEGSEDVPSPQ